MGPRRRRVPALTPLDGPQTEQERKERQRIHAKRNYYKKLNEVQHQREYVRQLEEEYMQLVDQKQAQTDTTTVDQMNPISDETYSPTDVEFLRNVVDGDVMRYFDTQRVAFEETSTISPARKQPSQRHQYMKLSTLKERLVAENQLLRDLITDHDSFAQKLSTLMQSNTMVLDDVPPYYLATMIEPLTRAFCDDVVRDAYDEMRISLNNRYSVFLSLVVFGWHDERVLYRDRVRYSLKKRYVGRTALELSVRAWSIFSVAKTYETLYATSTHVKYSFVQTVDEDNIIMLCAGPSPDGKVMVKTILLIGRRDIPKGVLIGFKSIDPKVLVPSKLPMDMSEIWVENLSCVTFTAVGDNDEHCEIEFTGDAGYNPLVSQAALLLEILFFILRFEGLLIGPMFSLC